MYTAGATPFSLRLRGESEAGFTTSRSTRYEISGVARFDGRELVLEWSCRARISEDGFVSSRRYEEEVSTGTCVLSPAEVASAELRGGWWRPRLEITTTTLAGTAHVPGARAGRLVLWLSRQDRALARELRSELRLASAEAALRAAQQLASLPPAIEDERGMHGT